jgi:hypothetical protein
MKKLSPSVFLDPEHTVMIGSRLYLDLRLLRHDPRLSCGTFLSLLGLIRSGGLYFIFEEN